MEAHQRRERARVQLGRVVRGIEQLAMQVAVDDAGRDLRDFDEVDVTVERRGSRSR